MTRCDAPDALADRIEREIRDGAFILLGPAEVALCVQALRHYAVPFSKQPMTAADMDAHCTRQPADQLHPKLVETLEAYGCTGEVSE